MHKSDETLRAIDKIHKVNFNSFNIDLMHGLPQQIIAEALQDLTTALACDPPHLSWYQLTIEPNTVFYKYPPTLPNDDITWEIQTQGEQILSAAGYTHYEVSAFAKPQQQCRHNINYWEFGDYLGIGAGAHGKVTDLASGTIQRMWKTRNPKDYLDTSKKFLAGTSVIAREQIANEYMLNRLRLFAEVNLRDYEQRTGLPAAELKPILEHAQAKGLVELTTDSLYLTSLGKRFLNDLLQMFLIDEVANA
ncbi:MAG TPA: coproporphyrinogen-III oxidase family protein [Gammaproteobacteria bacterium]|nr:coproporphyrinogen-III oxidase family protein [Gammaproteobacteria bacterium]